MIAAVRGVLRLTALLSAALPVATAQSSGPVLFETLDINRESGVVPAIAAADINRDGRPDIVAVSNDDVSWYENPSWSRHVITGRIKNLNVCLALYDLNHDGTLEIALGADWQFDNTASGGSLHLLVSAGDVTRPWRVIHLLDEEPTLHRIRWADVDGDSKPELIVAPLKGINSTAPAHQEAATRLFLLRPPADPFATPWSRETIDETLHVTHNIWPVRVGEKDAILAASFEGITKFERTDSGWSRELVVPGNGEPVPRSGAGEIKTGSLGAGWPVMATVEPWHGNNGVAYFPLRAGELHAIKHWRRHVFDPDMAGGHALGWADFDGDGADELVCGFRDNSPVTGKPGLHLYDFSYDPSGSQRIGVVKMVIDDGGMATEDAAIADFNGDGRPDVVAAGRATRNIRIYLNRGQTGAAGAK